MSGANAEVLEETSKLNGKFLEVVGVLKDFAQI